VPVTAVFTAAIDQPPELLDIAGALPARYPFLLESAASGPLGTYSLLLRQGDGDPILCLDSDGNLSGPGTGAGFLDRLDEWFEAEAAVPAERAEMPFAGGWFVYLGYELAAEIEPVLSLPSAGPELPVAFAARCKGAVVVDHAAPGATFLVAESPGVLEAMRAEIANVGRATAAAAPSAPVVVPDPAAEFEASVARIHRYLREGDVFQVNLSRGWRGRFQRDVDAVEIYRRLRRRNPAPFAALMRWRDPAVLSSSPERLVELRGDLVQTRPIAGTWPRGSNPDTDREHSRSLLAHPKERAEHIMLIDLERNDLGRVCRPGTVEVNELMVLETYTHVHHMVSNVRGRLRPATTPVDVIRAVFPGGTITGCPKVRCMEIIAELEGQGRGFYTGSMGYIGRDGSMDLNILIRSMLVHGREVRFRTGAGIVADSDARREVAETEAKAKGLLNALEC
jgi:anthranilate synthase component 1